MPSADLPEDHMGVEPTVLPPDVNKLPKVPGYEGIGHYGNGKNLKRIFFFN